LRLRENVRSGNLQVDTAEIPRRVEDVQAGKAVHIGSVDVSPESSCSNERNCRTGIVGLGKNGAKRCMKYVHAGTHTRALQWALRRLVPRSLCSVTLGVATEVRQKQREWPSYDA
jgi:hypothetical protein